MEQTTSENVVLAFIHTITCVKLLLTAFGLVIVFIELLQTVTTSDDSVIASSFTLHFTKARTKSSQSAVPSTVVAW
jgi:hypothetical protein